MKRYTVIATAPLRRPQILPTHIRVVASQFLHTRLVSRTDKKQFSVSLQRLSESRLTFKKYTFPQNYKGSAAIDLPAKMSNGIQEASRRRTAYIALGSNLGDRIGWIEKACNEMDARGIRVKRTSSLWETEPMYVLDQDRFVNGACEVCQSGPICCVAWQLSRNHQVETTLEPLELLDALQDIENSLGRKKIIDKGPRNIDLDILLYDNIKFSHQRLTIPHIGIPEREFVLRPLAE